MLKGKSPILIRAYDDSIDRDALSKIWLEASLESHDFIGAELIHSKRDAFRDEYLAIAQTFVAVHDSVPVGFISMIYDLIGGVFVVPQYQRQGIGRLLVEEAFKVKKSLKLEDYVKNKQAAAFYNALGFKEISRRDRDDQGLPYELAFYTLTTD